MTGAHLEGMGFKVLVGRSPVQEYQDVHNPAGEADVIRIIPVLAGSKSPWVRVLVGAALVAVAIVGSTFLGPLAMPIGALGASMIFGGVSQLLAKPPKLPDGYKEAERRESYLFNGPVNTSVQGASVTLVYGRSIVGSKVISAGIESYEE